jgi:Flp pilus assembly protein TadB
LPDLLLVAAVLAAGLACPAMMWWQHRRGRSAPCCSPRRPEAASLEALRKRQAAVCARIAELEDEARRG